MGIHMFRALMIYLTPVVPELSKQAQEFLNDDFNWDSATTVLTGHKISKFKALLQRVPMEKIEAMIEDSKEAMAAHSQICARVWTFDANEQIDLAFIQGRFERALRMRQAVKTLTAWPQSY